MRAVELAVAVAVAALTSSFFYAPFTTLGGDRPESATLLDELSLETGYGVPYTWSWLGLLECSFLFAHVLNTLALALAPFRIPDLRLWLSGGAFFTAVGFSETVVHWANRQAWEVGPLVYIALVTPALCLVYGFGLAIARQL